jgi:adhesin transport system outer membrane protein
MSCSACTHQEVVVNSPLYRNNLRSFAEYWISDASVRRPNSSVNLTSRRNASSCPRLRIYLAGWAVGLWVFTSQCAAETWAQQTHRALNESSLSLQQLWVMTDSPEGRLDIERPTLAKGVSGETPITMLSLDETRRRTLDESYILGASHSRLQSASYLADAAYAGVLPSLDLRAAQGRQTSTPSSRSDSVTGEALGSSSQARKELYAVVSQPLFDLSATAEIRRAAATQRASAADNAGVSGDVNYDSTAAFFGAVEAALTLKISRTQQQRLERLGKWVTERADAGGASGADRERIKARVLAAKSIVQDAIAQANQANITLSRLTGTMPQTLELPTLAASRPVGTLEDALALISTGNAAVLTARENEEAARQERRKHQARFTPTVKLELSTNRIANSGGSEGWTRDEKALVVFTLPLFSGGADYFKQRASLAKQQEYEYERLDAEREAARILQIAFSGLSSAREKINSLRKQAQAQAHVVEAFDAQLSSTTRNLLDVFDAYQQYNESQLNLVRTSVQAVLLEQQILRVTGQLASTTFSTMARE